MHSKQTCNKHYAILHTVSAAAHYKPAIVHMVEKDTHHKNSHVTDTSRDNQAADNKGNAGGQCRKRNKPCERHTQREADGTEEFPESGHIPIYYPGDGMYTQDERYNDTNNIQATVRPG
jgi:hypothetical protein